MTTVEFLARYGYLLLFGARLADQLGLPIPAAPVVLAAGALARTGQMRLDLVIALSVIAAVIGNLVWYEAGRRRGTSVLRFLCKLSIEPDTCVRRTQDLFANQGARTILMAPWIPGLGGVAPPLAGMTGMPLRRFLPLAAASSLVWAATFAGLGYAFGNQLEWLLQHTSRFGAGLFAVAAAALAVWIGFKFWQRQRVLRDLRVARIYAHELKALIDRGESVVIVDLRAEAEGTATLPGALRIAAEHLETRAHEIPRDRHIILACS